jgi:hypothetical protein
MSTPGARVAQHISDHFPRLGEILAVDEKVCRAVVGAMGSVVEDWWDCEGVDCPETSLNHLCSTFQDLLEGNYLANQVTLDSLVPPLVPVDLTGTPEPSRAFDEWSLEIYQRFLDGRVGSTKSGFAHALIRVGVLARKGWELTFYREEGRDENGPDATT